MTSAGYSSRSLAEKLGIRPGTRVALLGAPAGYEALLGEVLAQVQLATSLDAPQPYDFIQAFYLWQADLRDNFPRLKAALTLNGALWLSWPKKAAKVPTDLTEQIIRESGLETGLVDIKVAAVDPVWSGLKFVRRLKDRQAVPISTGQAGY